MINGIVRIPIVGPIARDLDPLEKLFFGLVDTNDIAAQLDQAERDPLCRSILLEIDSPGGTFNGTPELASRIEQVQKPIYAYSPGLICSAAYWLAAATDGIFMTQSADAGSIGIYCVFPDLSQAAQMAGVKIQVFSSGKYKGAGVPGTALTQDQAKLLQDRINNLAAMFSGYLAGRRPIAEGDMQGQSFTGADAWDHNLVDAIADNEAEVLALL
jgi:signal peptide peptidase SppA